MKIALRTALSIIGLAVIICITFYACKKPVADVDLIVNTSGLSKSPMLVQFANANSSSAAPQAVDVTISGPGANLVQVDGGGTNFTLIDGLLPLTLKSAAKPSNTNPVVFNLYAQAEGFAPVSKSFTITADTAITTIIKMTEYANPPAGVAVVNQQTALDHGMSDSVVLAAYNNNSVENVKVIIPKGTTMLNALGAPIDASQLTSTMVYYGTTNPAGYDAFPGGFNLPGYFNLVTGSYLSLNLLAGNTPVVKFSQPVKVLFKVNPNLVNPNTQAPVAYGDLIDFWTRDEAANTWQKLNVRSIQETDNGKLAVSYSTDQLSTIGINWQSYNCNTSSSISFHLSDKTAKIENYAVTIETPNGQFIGGPYDDKWPSHAVTLTDGYKISTTIPGVGKVKAGVYATPGDPTSKVFESPLFDACGGTTIDANITTPTQPDYINTVIKAAAICTDRNMRTSPSAWVQIQDTGTGKIRYAYMRNGALSTRLINKHSYTLKLIFANNEYGSKAILVDRTKASGNVESSSGIYGYFNYSTATSVLSISTSFNIDCH